ncbi:glycoside hydrolase family 5 protein [Cylindrobasidium torrendii FP15055 ss-10]|uniref:mannan endo-1,4-beta-mannosidase n=1 Tax=Cylindrobasidium torrendii FP15055 ss-10 TaxID=1314674 RepID=A0A0D7ASQ7_9AGAR|nr:glycoside hydrolase family 5 protein [Cylindrobasidium torrendii FP15055 ss-10]
MSGHSHLFSSEPPLCGAMKTFLTLLAFTSVALAVVSEYGQCGGQNWAGETTCADGLACTSYNEYYSQCIKSTSSAATTSTTTIKASSTTSGPFSTTKTTASSSATAVPLTGYVKTSGTKFTLDGKVFTPVGQNSYWVGLSSYNTTVMDLAFKDMTAVGATVVRTWGFNEVVGGPAYDGQIYYQNWNGTTPAINTGSDGLASFDNVVATAKANNVKLIVALTNNWSDYGGMDVYVKQILGSDNHDLFYTDEKVIAAFKDYIKTFVTRYKDETTIMAWELGNEPRCRGSTGTSTGTCTPAILTAWAKDISAYIKSLDSNHLVALGDEGFYNQPSAPTYPYQGGEGIDFDANLNISTLDFGTFHSYPISWGQTSDPQGWGTQWITDHAASMKAANKPVIIEEFGVDANQTTVYTAWYAEIESSGLTGDLIWQAGSYLPT